MLKQEIESFTAFLKTKAEECDQLNKKSTDQE